MKKGDKILLISLTISIVFGFLSIHLYKYYKKSNTKIAIIKHDGKIVKEINLSTVKENTDFTLKASNGHFNKISIKKNAIRVEEADCPDKVCIKTGWISEQGDTIVCLPNKLIIKIKGVSKNINNVDATTY
ncbi:NusG domain II-containing protein [Clostridium rectalis]|uniref:NusG domain II-containing protein n=1 Tax=Clostridium rectalis TaxID=2040295 RepID=UPI000F62C47C|nr:NusG domain II-containing protein [Clostridium rectalis]